MMSSQPSSEVSQRKSKQQATKSISEQARKKPLVTEDVPSSASTFSVSVYGSPAEHGAFPIPPAVIAREAVVNGFLKTVSEMYFGSVDPFAEILRCLDDRIDPNTRKYVSGLETLLKNEIQEYGNTKGKASKEKVIVTPLDLLACPFRKPEVIDQWSPYDTALFELAICEHRGFHPKKMAAMFGGRRSMGEVSDFFEDVYSKSANWRKIQKLLNNEELTDEDSDIEMKDESHTSSIDSAYGEPTN